MRAGIFSREFSTLSMTHFCRKKATRIGALLLSAALVVVAVVGCGRNEQKAGTAKSSGGHTHTAPHGGELVELGDHQYNLELVYDGGRGVLQVWVLDGHAENFIRLPIAGFQIEVDVDGKKQVLEMLPVANPVTGETIGDTALFEARAEFLMSANHFDGVIKAIKVRDSDFRNVRFHFHSGSGEHSH
jgi:hypothetical protein